MKMTGKKNRKTVSMAFAFIRTGNVVPHVSVSGSFYHRVAAVLTRLTQGIISCHLFSNFPIKSHFRDCYLKERVETFPPINNPRRSLNFLFSSVLVQFINCIIKNCQTYVFASKIRSCQMNQGGSLMANP